jgi:hypothetical protein
MLNRIFAGKTLLRLCYLFYFLAVVILYKNLYGHMLVNPDVYLPRDNWLHSYQMFDAFVTYIRNFHMFPCWYFTPEGGLWIEPLSNNYLTLLPYKFIGYLFVPLFKMDSNVGYKISFMVIGIGIYLYGLYRLSVKLFGSRTYSHLLLFICLTSSVVVSLFHQEQVLATVFYIPFIWISILNLRRDGNSLLVISVLLGLSLNNHYPQLIFCYVLALVVSCAVAFNEVKFFLRDAFSQVRKGGTKLMILSLLGFIISASPLFYSYITYKDSLVSVFRNQSASVQSTNYDDYVKMQKLSFSNLYPKYLLDYFGMFPDDREFITIYDKKTLFMTAGIPFALLLTLLMRVPFKRFQLSMIVLLAFLAVGVYGPAPRMLWSLMPGIGLFRQWYHFVSFLNLHLLFMLFFAFLFFVRMSETDKKIYKKIIAIGLILLVLTVAGACNVAYALVPIGLLALKLLLHEQHRFKKMLPFLMVVWVSLSAIQWSCSSIYFYELASLTRPLSAQSLVKRPTMFIADLLGPLYRMRQISISSTFYKPLVSIKGVSEPTIRQLFGQGQFFWRENKNQIQPIQDDALQVEAVSNGFKVTITDSPPQATGLVMLQYHDGRWDVRDEDQKSLTVESGLLKMVQIPMTEMKNKTIFIRRLPSLWNFLIILMWVPLLGVCIVRLKAVNSMSLDKRK